MKIDKDAYTNGRCMKERRNRQDLNELFMVSKVWQGLGFTTNELFILDEGHQRPLT